MYCIVSKRWYRNISPNKNVFNVKLEKVEKYVVISKFANSFCLNESNKTCVSMFGKYSKTTFYRIPTLLLTGFVTNGIISFISYESYEIYIFKNSSYENL